MPEFQTGESAPKFDLPSTKDQKISLDDYSGQRVVLYFYPKDDTSGCTKEACAFEALLPQLQKLNVAVLGVSKDPISKHEKFAAKYDLTFPLLSDAGDDVCERYGVWKEKSMYGKSYMGIERSTFLIGPDGKIEHIWRKVKVDGHVEDVMDKITAADKAA